MKKRSGAIQILLVIIALVTITSFCYCKEEPLNLTVSSDKKLYQVNECIKIKLEIKNISQQPVVINTRGEAFKIEIKGPSGDIVTPKKMIVLKIGPPKEKDFIKLNSNENWDSGFITISPYEEGGSDYAYLDRCYDISSIGEYVIKAQYTNYYRESYNYETSETKKIEAWIGTLTSNNISLAVAEKELAILRAQYDELNSIIAPSKGTTRKAVEQIYGEPNIKATPCYSIYKLCNGLYQMDVQYDDNNLVLWTDIPLVATVASSYEMRITQLKYEIRNLSTIYADYGDRLKKASWNKDRTDFVKIDFITEDKAIELAKKACVGKLEIPAGAPAAVELKNKIYIITFKTQWPKGTMGGDYYAQVSIDAVSGKVLEILGSD